ncbi:hypothetical protein EBU71_12905 [bacterium]|nr:hypothetical protein [Candidatus Elulimicrobium humile]
MTSSINTPHHRLNNSTGFEVFSKQQNTVSSFGIDGKYQFKWSASIGGNLWYPDYTISISVDGGVNWHEEHSVWSIYNWARSNLAEFGIGYHDDSSPLHKAIIEARNIYNKNRRRELAKERRKAFNALSDEDKIRIRQERAEAWTKRKERAAERKAELTARIMNQMLELGPELVRLREDIDRALALMAQGGVDRAFPYYHSRRRYIRNTKWTVADIQRHIEKAHTRKIK